MQAIRSRKPSCGQTSLRLDSDVGLGTRDSSRRDSASLNDNGPPPDQACAIGAPCRSGYRSVLATSQVEIEIDPILTRRTDSV